MHVLIPGLYNSEMQTQQTSQEQVWESGSLAVKLNYLEVGQEAGDIMVLDMLRIRSPDRTPCQSLLLRNTICLC
jgi:hypothetical protein